MSLLKTFFWLYLCSHTAMLKKPVVTEVRTPTNTWSGLGFSKSMPAETIKELRRANHVPYKPSMSTTYEVRHALSWWWELLWHSLSAFRTPCWSSFSVSGFPAVLVSIQQPRRHRERQWLWQLAREERHWKRTAESHRVPLCRQQPKEEAEQIWSVIFM